MSSNPQKYTAAQGAAQIAQQMPMGSHATAGCPHESVAPQGFSKIPAQGVQGVPFQMPMQQMPMQQMPFTQTVPMPQFPTGQTAVPTIPIIGVQQPSLASPVDFSTLGTTPVMDTEYTQGYLRTQIGKRVKVEFLIGTSMQMDRDGVLVDVGISYIIINETDTDDLVLCDIYSIKFVRFYY